MIGIVGFIIALLVVGSDAHRRVPLADITALTFTKGVKTTGRRAAPIDQLSCRGKSCYKYEPEVVQCTVTGHNGNDPQWACKGTFPKGLDLGRTDVICEGYEDVNDPFILEGSCGLEYTLIDSGYTEPRPEPTRTTTTTVSYDDGYDYGTILFGIFMIALMMFIIVGVPAHYEPPPRRYHYYEPPPRRHYHYYDDTPRYTHTTFHTSSCDPPPARRRYNTRSTTRVQREQTSQETPQETHTSTGYGTTRRR